MDTNPKTVIDLPIRYPGQPVPLQPEWTKHLDSREWSQVLHAQVYARDHLGAGAPGHGQFMLIAKLAAMLDAHDGSNVTAALSPTESISDAIGAIEDIAELVGWPCIDRDQAEDNFVMTFKHGGL